MLARETEGGCPHNICIYVTESEGRGKKEHALPDGNGARGPERQRAVRGTPIITYPTLSGSANKRHSKKAERLGLRH
jgi:hypothetical protein